MVDNYGNRLLCWLNDSTMHFVARSVQFYTLLSFSGHTVLPRHVPPFVDRYEAAYSNWAAFDHGFAGTRLQIFWREESLRALGIVVDDVRTEFNFTAAWSKSLPISRVTGRANSSMRVRMIAAAFVTTAARSEKFVRRNFSKQSRSGCKRLL